MRRCRATALGERAVCDEGAPTAGRGDGGAGGCARRRRGPRGCRAGHGRVPHGRGRRDLQRPDHERHPGPGLGPSGHRQHGLRRRPVHPGGVGPGLLAPDRPALPRRLRRHVGSVPRLVAAHPRRPGLGPRRRPRRLAARRRRVRPRQRRGPQRPRRPRRPHRRHRPELLRRGPAAQLHRAAGHPGPAPRRQPALRRRQLQPGPVRQPRQPDPDERHEGRPAQRRRPGQPTRRGRRSSPAAARGPSRPATTATGSTSAASSATSTGPPARR